MMRTALQAVLAGALLLAGAAAPAAVYPDSAIQTAQRAALPAHRQLERVLAAGDESALVALAGAWRAAAASDPLTYEWLLHELAAGAGRMPETGALRALLADLATYAPQARGWLEHHGRAVPVLLYPVDGAARAALGAWRLRADAQAARRALGTGDAPALRALDDRAVAAAAEDLVPAALRAWGARAEALGPRALAALARRTGDLAFWERLAATGSDAETIRFVAQAPALLPAEGARAVLERAVLNPALASAAALAMGRLPRTPELEARLVAGFSDARLGSSYAAALARDASPWARARLGELVLAQGDGPVLRHALLALRDDPHPDATHALARFAARPDAPPRLRDRVAAWRR